MPVDHDLRVFADRDALADAAAALIAAELRQAVAAEGRATIALSGGSTPAPVYRRLAAAELDWSRIHVAWGDDRCVPHDAADSNVRLAREALLDHVPIPAANVHAMPTTLAPEAAARAYEATLRGFFGGPLAFTVNLLGMGDDGHTASLFPRAPALDEAERLVLHTEAPPASPVRDRLTLTLPALNAARLALFLAAGGSKRGPLAEVLAAYAANRPDGPPASRVRPAAGRLAWMVDAAAAPAGSV